MDRNAPEIIKQKLSIESVVGSYIKLDPAGKNFKACCPFHNEKTPSFQVTPDLGIFYCFGCHKGGDIFTFVQEIEGLSFSETLKMLAEKAGVTLDVLNASQGQSRISILRQIMDDAAKFYEIGLRTHASAVDYLQSRGMTKETMVSFRIGYAEKDWAKLYDYLKRKKYSDDDILATGLCLKGKQSGLYDRFRERIMFPIMDPQGRVIAFTGRVLPGTEEASRPVGKYINSPETELYHKSQVLFGYDQAKQAIHTQGFVIIVEGQMDCIMSHQVGVKNVVALSGTASTEWHMKQLRRFTDKVAICLDADDAGLVAAQKTAMVAYQHDMKVLVIDITSGKDPADMINHNPEDWKNAIHHRKDVITFRLEKMKLRSEFDQKNIVLEKEIFPLLQFIQSEITLDDKLQEIAHAFGSSSVDPVRKEFEKYRRDHQIDTVPTSSTSVPHVESSLGRQLDILEQLLQGILSLDHPDTIAYVSEWERSLGPVVDNRTSYERLRDSLKIRKEIEIIDIEKKEHTKALMHEPHNAELLQKIQDGSRRKDALVRELTSH